MLTERGRWATTTHDERGRIVVGALTERGAMVVGAEEAPTPSGQPMILRLTTVPHVGGAILRRQHGIY